ncbi:roadblock/LC7 domain-containing protein [Phytomonospora endophytica]|uniref:Putative regulator of Ras-like GTPase activity (Roadblock/LC7/MglB family) n=1 Tax=Phytomonospora endophytica TaxID=714109 RepID=A0A841FZ49_9ACTN|nr:roadblock/LC7 domain-containing protein [Phytomonospora endophytica]MBB6037719.1 putative regulator of Ras-like GTPase activity (Roadblock/LC7/MglB family) [Phytomonospora endophytica]GIG67753.1 hypothetical protein Pen01_40480 [Phytomonospora endophytica]
MTTPMALDTELTRQLDRITREKGCRHALLFTIDGLVKACSTGLERDVADPVAAGLSGMHALSRTLDGFCDASELVWTGSIVQFVGYTILLVTAGEKTCLGVSVAADLRSDETMVIAATAVKVVRAMEPHLAVTERGT